MKETPIGGADEHAKRPDRDQMIADGINRAADEGLGPHPLPDSYCHAVQCGVDAVLASITLSPGDPAVTEAQVKAAQAEIAKLASYNVELRPDGSEDRETAAYVAGIEVAHGAMRVALEAAAAA